MLKPWLLRVEYRLNKDSPSSVVPVWGIDLTCEEKRVEFCIIEFVRSFDLVLASKKKILYRYLATVAWWRRARPKTHPPLFCRPHPGLRFACVPGLGCAAWRCSIVSERTPTFPPPSCAAHHNTLASAARNDGTWSPSIVFLVYMHVVIWSLHKVTRHEDHDFLHAPVQSGRLPQQHNTSCIPHIRHASFRTSRFSEQVPHCAHEIVHADACARVAGRFSHEIQYWLIELSFTYVA